MVKEIKLSQGKVALVDDADYERVRHYKWFATKQRNDVFYAMAYDSEHGKNIRMHRIILNAPASMLVDHINRNTLDNRRCNLRFATQSQNHMNARRRFKTSSDYKGVYFDKNTGKWRAQIKKDTHNRMLGSFVTQEDAARAYDKAARKLFGEYARTNFQE